jgi:hypothetical protein
MIPIDAPGNSHCSIASYGETLRANKAKLHTAFEGARLPFDLRVLMLAMGMLESTSLCASHRDSGKDSSKLSKNVSLFNLSVDLVQHLGYKGNADLLNRDDMLRDVVILMRSGMDRWGVDRFLNFVRGGRTAFKDGKSYGAADYRNTIKSMVVEIHKDKVLLHDDRRVDSFLKHV